jgi:hypothetical protein
MSEFSDLEVLAQLDSATEWNSPAIVETDSGWLLSLDVPCRRLAQAFVDYVADADLIFLRGDDLVQELARIVSKIHEQFDDQQDLVVGSVVQTRGNGVCLTFDEQGLPGEHVLLDDESRLRGTVIGIGCLPILTNEALAGEEMDATGLPHEPTLCLLINNTNTSEFGDIVSFQDVMAIALRQGSTHLDQVIARQPTIT